MYAAGIQPDGSLPLFFVFKSPLEVCSCIDSTFGI